MTPQEHDALATAGIEALHIARLWWLYLGVCAAVFALVTIALAAALVRRRVNRRGDGEGPALATAAIPDLDNHKRPLVAVNEAQQRRMLHVVLGATGTTVATLFLLLFASVATGRALVTSLETSDALVVEITGHQWWWNVRYPNDTDPTKELRTANELHIPVGRTVLVKLASVDVIHSFWVPSLHGKRDLVPGHDTELVLRADRPGVFRGQCAEFCGAQHANMALLVVAESPDDFDRWRTQQLAPARDPVTDVEKRGKTIFENGPCSMCHAIAGTKAGAQVAPDLTHLMSRQTLAAGELPNVRGHLAGWIVNAQSLKPGSHMPSINLDADELHALLAYLETLR